MAVRVRSRRWRAMLAASMTAAVACRGGPVRPQKTHLARLPESVGEIAVADDARSYAYVEKNGAEGRVVHDGIRDAPFPEFGIMTFAPVTRRLFYWAGSANGPTASGVLVVDGAPLAARFGRDADITFSADGRHWATASSGMARRKDDEVEPGPAIVFADGRELGRYPDASLPALSPDGGHVAYLVATDDGATKLVVDGTERTTYAAPDPPCAARAKPRAKGHNPEYWPQFQVRYLSDGRLLVMTRDRDGWAVYRDGTRLGTYESSRVQPHPGATPECRDVSAIAAWSLTTAEKAPVAAWVERLPGEQEQWRVVVDGKPVDGVVCPGPYLRQPPELTPDGEHVAYACPVSDDKFSVVGDGQRFGPYRDVWAYTWSDDGAHLAYGGSDGLPPRPWRYYVDGRVVTEAFGSLWRPRFEPGTSRLAWEAELERYGRGWIGIDRRRIASFDEVVSGPSFVRRGVATWVVRRGRRLTRLDVPTG